MKLGRQAKKVIQIGTTAGTFSFLLFTHVVKAAESPELGTQNSEFRIQNAELTNISTGDNETQEVEINNQEINSSSAPSAPSAPPTPPLPHSPTPSTPTSSPEVKILTPTVNQVLDTPAATVVLQFVSVDRNTSKPVAVELRVNGKLVNPSLIGRTENDSSNDLVTQTWYGVALEEGENTITAQIAGNGNTPITSVKVQVRGAATKIKISSVKSRIPADGRSTTTIQGELRDERGNRSNRDALITLVSSAGEFTGADYDRDRAGFQVKARQGQFSATLRSDLNAQTVQVKANTLNLEGFTQLQFETNLRPSLVTGVVNFRIGARGTDYYDSFRNFLPPDRKNGTQIDLNGAVFATGRIGEWLLTGAYNSDRTLNQTCYGGSRLFSDAQFCEKTYPVYGDSSKVERVTPSQDSLYLRLERSARIPGADPDYAMWGDFNTSEFSTRSQQFTATTRQLHGFKANYNLGNLQLTGLYANNTQGFQRDTLPPDGTSGYYFLSRRLLMPGSENVFIETEELNRPGTVINRTSLSRSLDYDIDYDRGALLFRKPVLRTDIGDNGEVLVRRIVVTYQYESQDSNNSLYGGRVRYHFSRTAKSESWIGATYLRETQGIHNFEIYGADALISLGSKAQLIAEYAHSQNQSDFTGFAEGSAYRLEAEGEIAKGIQGRAYYSSVDAGFANNATVSFVPGQTRYGAQLTAKVTPTTNFRVQYDHEDNYGVAPRPLDAFEDLFAPRTQAVPGSRVDNSLTTYSAGIEQQIGKATVQADYIHRDRTDRLANNPLTSSSDQLRTRLKLPLTSKLLFQAQNETTLAGQDAVYSDRTLLGLDWALLPGINLRLAHQLFHTGPLQGNGITSLNLVGDYKLGSDTTLTGRYSIIGGIDGITNQGAIGLNQRWNIATGLKLDLAYEHIFGNFFTTTATGTQFAQPFAVGQSAAALGLESGDNYSIGLEYTDNPAFQASARYEHRTSSKGNNTVISAAATGKISSALTALFRYHQANASNQTLVGLGDTRNLKLGLAYRNPDSDKFNALLRYEYRKNPAVIPDTILLGTGTGSEDHTLALEAIYAPNWQWELYGKYAMRHSVSHLASDLVNSSSVSLGQIRATYRLGYSMDLVGEARWIGQPSAGYSETGFVVEAGYYLTPNLRAAIGYSAGNVIDRDFDNSRSAGGMYASLTVKLNELFSGFGIQKPAPRPPQESVVQPLATNNIQIPKELRLELAQNLPFHPNEATVDDSNNSALNNLVTVLQQYPSLTVEIQGYIPSLASNEAPNLDTQRVISARNYLLSKGIKSPQIILRSVGKRRPESQGIGNDELTQATAVNFVLTGASETFALMASRLQNGGTNSPAIDLLQSILPQADLDKLADASTTKSNNEITTQVAQIPNHTINFSLDATINSNSESVLNEVATKLQHNSNLTVEIQGYITASVTHTDNSELEMERVMAVRSSLIDKGIDANQIIIRSLEQKQLVTGDKIAQNSSVDLIFNSVQTTAQTTDTTDTKTTASNTPTETLQSLAPSTKPDKNFSDIEVPAVSFTLDTKITPESEAVLDKVATTLQDNPRLKIEISGFISVNPGENSELDLEKLMAVRSYLIEKGVEDSQILISSLDEKQQNARKTANNSNVDLNLSPANDIATAETTPIEFSENNTLSLSDRLIPALALLPPESANFWFGNDLTNGTQKVSFAIDFNTNQIVGMVLPEQLPLKAEVEDSTQKLLRLATALNSLLGEDKAAVDLVLRAMRITQPKVQGIVIDPAMLDQLSGGN